MSTSPRKKLIEVSLPLDAINTAAAKEKSIRHGHPSTFHLWWSRKPLAACRAVLFASIIDDPSSQPERFPTKEAQDAERDRLHHLIERMVPWEATQDEVLMKEVRDEILTATGGNPPSVSDPFCGGGSIPLEAQRLGLEAFGSDLNPVPVLITKALVEIPPRFANHPPINPDSQKVKLGSWRGAQGLAEDVRYYGEWLRNEAKAHIGYLYPNAKLPKELGGGEATVIAWLWARTVTCPNPACNCQIPLTSKWNLSTKKGKETHVHPLLDRTTSPVSISFQIRKGLSPEEGTVNRRGATCVACGSAIPFTHIRLEGKAGRMGSQMIAIAAEYKRGRIYLPPDENHIKIANSAVMDEKPTEELPKNPRDFKTSNYGLTSFGDLYTTRQLVALNTLGRLLTKVRERVESDAIKSPYPKEYADAIALYLAIGISKLSDAQCTLVTWSPGMDQAIHAFTKQALPMVWDFAESNIFNGFAGDLNTTLKTQEKVLQQLPCKGKSNITQMNASIATASNVMYSVDPPYFDNISYAELADFFYIWLKRMLGPAFPHLFGTILTPKTDELVATPYRFEGDAKKAETHFQSGLTQAFLRMREQGHPDFPATVYYAFKQSETDDEDETPSTGQVIANTGWETMLEGLVQTGYSITATWPMRTERKVRSLALGTNALASSIVLVCRPRPATAKPITRREFLNTLRSELPEALRLLQRSHIAPVDLAQAAIGPGMAVFSRYAKVLEADGSTMSVRTALQLINKALDEFLTEQEGDFDADSRWALTWFEQHGYDEGPYGVAETLSKARNTSVEGLEEAGILLAKGGKVRLLKREELPTDWNPEHDSRLTVWESVQHLIRVLEGEGEAAAGRLLLKLGPMGDIVRELAYRLYALCERKRWSQEAQAYNGLIVSWGSVQGQASVAPKPQVAKQGRLALED